MILFYENFILKENAEITDESDYAGYMGENSIYNSDVFVDINPNSIIEKDIIKVLDKANLNPEDKAYITNLFEDYKCYFIYNTNYGKYYLPMYFTEEEMAEMSESLRKKMWKEKMYIQEKPEIKKLDLARYGGDTTKQKLGIFMIFYTKEELDTIE